MMTDPSNPLSWRDVAAAYDPRGLPFMRYFVEAGMTQDDQRSSLRVLVRNALLPGAKRR